MEVRKNEIFQDTENSKEFSREEKDDEISIDLSKIKAFFKRKKEEVDRKPEQEEEKPEVATEPENKDTKTEHKSDETTDTIQDEQKNDDEINIDAQKSKISGIPENSDEEFSLDFGKIKNIFKKIKGSGEIKKEVAETAETKTEKDDDEISIDFSKLKNIKNIFKRSGKETESDEDISLDFKKFSDFFVQHRIIFLLLIPIFLSIFLRVQPAYLPITDEWATNSVNNNLKSQISSQIDQQYPNLPAQNKDPLVENELQKVRQQQKSQIDQQIRATSNFFKSKLQDDTGQTYLLAIDPYFWMRHAQNILKNGHPGDELREGNPWDNHMLAPKGRFVPPDMFHAYFEAYLFKFLSFFNKNLNLMSVVFFVPVLISALSVIPTFFITRKLVGNFGGFIAATVVAIHPSFLTRTVGGFADTDAYNVMFPLFIAWLFIEALEAKNMKNSIILSAINGILVGLYSFTWGGWWYIFDFVLISAVFYIAYYAFVHRKELIRNFTNIFKRMEIKKSFIFLVVFFIISALSVSIVGNFEYFTQFAKNPGGFAKQKEVGITTVWPNVLTTVAEQNPASLNNVINQVGLGKFYFFLIALMGITLTLTTKERKKLWFVIGTLVWYLIIFLLKIQDLNTFLILISIPIIIRILLALWQSDTGIDIKYAILLILWFIATTYASTKGVRFTLLLVPVFAIGFGIALGHLYRYASVWIAKGLQVNKYVSKITVVIILILLLVPIYSSAKRTADQEIPSFNDAWALSLEKIKSDSQPNAIINSWWDFGHWFKFWADRPVTFDGTTQTTPQAHFIGNALLTDDEDVSIGILRMLDCGENGAFNTILEITEDFVDSINLLYEIIPGDKENSRKILSEKFNETYTEKILNFTHCQPPENYFITSEDMIGKAGVWSHFGSWNFDRALIYNTLKKKEYRNDLDKSADFLQQKFNMSKSQAEDLFYEVQSITTSSQANNWIAPWPGYIDTSWHSCSFMDENTTVLKCDYFMDIGDTQNNQDIILESSFIDENNIADTYVIIGYYDKRSGARVGDSASTPNALVVSNHDDVSKTKIESSNLNLDILLETGTGSYRSMIFQPAMSASMFNRLFMLEGIGLKHFKKFSDETSVFGGRIIVWKVDWEGKEKNVIEIPKPEPEEKEIEEVVNETNTSELNISQNT